MLIVSPWCNAMPLLRQSCLNIYDSSKGCNCAIPKLPRAFQRKSSGQYSRVMRLTLSRDEKTASSDLSKRCGGHTECYPHSESTRWLRSFVARYAWHVPTCSFQSHTCAHRILRPPQSHLGSSRPPGERKCYLGPMGLCPGLSQSRGAGVTGQCLHNHPHSIGSIPGCRYAWICDCWESSSCDLGRAR